MEELEVGGLDDDLGPLPSNLLDPPMWSHDEHASGSCGPWQKPYTHMHRGKRANDNDNVLSLTPPPTLSPPFPIPPSLSPLLSLPSSPPPLPLHAAMLSGELPPSYLIYTTGHGFPPIISGVPEAMKGIATVFLLALLTGIYNVPLQTTASLFHSTNFIF